MPAIINNLHFNVVPIQSPGCSRKGDNLHPDKSFQNYNWKIPQNNYWLNAFQSCIDLHFVVPRDKQFAKCSHLLNKLIEHCSFYTIHKFHFPIIRSFDLHFRTMPSILCQNYTLDRSIVEYFINLSAELKQKLHETNKLKTCVGCLLPMAKKVFSFLIKKSLKTVFSSYGIACVLRSFAKQGGKSS